MGPQRVAERPGRLAIGEREEPEGQCAQIGESSHLNVLLSIKVEQVISSAVDRASATLKVLTARAAPWARLSLPFQCKGVRRRALDPPTAQSWPHRPMFDRGLPGRGWAVRTYRALRAIGAGTQSPAART